MTTRVHGKTKIVRLCKNGTPIRAVRRLLLITIHYIIIRQVAGCLTYDLKRVYSVRLVGGRKKHDSALRRVGSADFVRYTSRV